MNRGSDDRPERTAWKSLGFNEAPIHESGKSDPRRCPFRRGPRFNEAPIHESGKLFKTQQDKYAEQWLQ